MTGSASLQSRKFRVSTYRTYDRVVPLLLALSMGAWSLRGVGTGDLTEMDAARHAMNGALIYDAIRLGHITDLVAFTVSYFTRFPALSMPYHPPLFPVFEAVVYALTGGVSAASARIAVAICVAGSVFLLCTLIRSTHESWGLAVAAVLVFCFVPLSQNLSTEVMLEFPAMFCVVASTLAWRWSESDSSLRYVIVSAILAGAGVWTKQTVFVAGLPLTVVILERGWERLRQRPIWIWYGVFLVPVTAYAFLLYRLKWNGMGAFWARRSVSGQILHNFEFYSRVSPLTLACVAAAVLLVGFILLRPNLLKSDFVRTNAIYMAWLVCAVGIAVVVPAYDQRYLFFAFPPFIVICLDAVLRLSSAVGLNRARTSAALIVLSMLWAIVNLRPPQFLRGPRDAATFVLQRGARRILYCGAANGQFIFDVRTLDPGLQTSVLRGDKLPPGVFSPGSLREFVERYGIDYVILQQSEFYQPWNSLWDELPFPVAHTIELQSSDWVQRGRLRILRTGISPGTFDRHLRVHINSLGRDLDLAIE